MSKLFKGEPREPGHPGIRVVVTGLNDRPPDRLIALEIFTSANEIPRNSVVSPSLTFLNGNASF